MNTELPSFLHGCFDWRENGFHWAHTPDIDILSSGALRSTNPWVVLAAVVEHAKHGDHDRAQLLRPFFFRREPFALARVSLLVYADIARSSELVLLREVLQSDDPDSRSHAAEAAALAGSLALVPDMLHAWTRAEGLHQHETIGFAISDILESQPGPIADHVNVWDPKSSGEAEPDTPRKARLLALQAKLAESWEPSEFPSLVAEANGELRKKFGDEAYVWAGQLTSVPALLDQLFVAVKQTKAAGFISMRHRFEASTGVDCRAFFHAFEPQRLEIAAALESFVQSGELDQYEPGRRYFWGHAIR